MNKISAEKFISDYLPESIQNKIFHYAVESPISKQNEYNNHFFNFGGERYNTKTTNSLENFLPFRKDEFYKKSKIPKTTIFNIHVSKNIENNFILFKKVMKTNVTNEDIVKIKNTGHMLITKQNGRRRIIECKYLDIENVKKFKYVNSIELSNFPVGLFLSENETIYVYYTPYNNGCSRKYALHNDKKFHSISISPLQMLWRINYGLITMKELIEYAKINKIKGRSKLKSRDDYVKAFMKL